MRFENERRHWFFDVDTNFVQAHAPFSFAEAVVLIAWCQRIQVDESDVERVLQQRAADAGAAVERRGRRIERDPALAVRRIDVEFDGENIVVITAVVCRREVAELPLIIQLSHSVAGRANKLC